MTAPTPHPDRSPVDAPAAGDTTTPEGLIAVTALDCRFPGAPDTAALWDLIVSGRSGLTRHEDTGERTNDPAGRMPGNPARIPVSGLIEGQDLFDPEPFGLTDAEAAPMDPQQRLFLEACARALENSGHARGAGAGAVGVFAGASHSDYLARNLGDRYLAADRDPVGSLQAAMAGVADYLPLHVAHRLGLTGPAVCVGTTCSTSLVAVHLAAQSLLAQECDTALAGGSSLIVPQGGGYLHIPDGIFSADGHVRTFSAEGTGIVHTQGVGVAVLRRLEDALADGDPILAVIHGSAIGNDGADRTGFTAPSPRGQARVISEALEVAGIDPRMIGYLEAHGTATRLGDVVEVAALRRVFGAGGPARCTLGSVKANIGHANSAAGIAGFARAVLALHHAVLPPALDAFPLNPDLELEDSPFRVAERATPWKGERYAGVSSFGIGGTNCHVVLGAAPERPAPVPDPRPQLALFSAHRDDALAGLLTGVAGVAGGSADGTPDGGPGPAVPGAADIAYTLHAGRPALLHRAAAVLTGDPAGDARAVATAARRAVPAARPRLVLAFPGGGAQYPGMAHGLLAEPDFAATVDRYAELFDTGERDRPTPGADLRSLLTAPPGDERATRLLRDPAHGLPALFTVCVAVANTLRARGVEPDAVVGHSLGEYAAAVVAGVLSPEDAASLVMVRSRAMSRTAGGGTMLAVALPEPRVRDLLRHHAEIDLAVVNGPEACVVSGPASAVAALEAGLTAEGVRVNRLLLDAAAHSRLVEPALEELRAVAERVAARPPRIPLATTLTGGPLEAAPDAEHWVSHLRSTVRFADALATAVGPGPTALLQAGPGHGLLQLARAQHAERLATAVTSMPPPTTIGEGRAALLAACGELWTHGVAVPDVAALHRPGRRRLVLPGAPLRRRRLWIDPPASPAPGTGEAGQAPDESEPFQLPVWHRTPPPTTTALSGRWLITGTGRRAESIRAAFAGAGAEVVAVTTDTEACDGVVVVDPGHGTGADTPNDTAGRVATAILDCAAVAAATAPWARNTCLVHVAAGAQQVESADRPRPADAAALAVPRVLSQEFPGLRWRTVDLPVGLPAGVDAAGDADVDAGDVTAVCREAADLATGGDSGMEVALRGRHRWVRSLAHWRPEEAVEPRSAGDPAATVLVIGGLGDVGLTVAGHLARTGRRVVVTGRTGLDGDAGSVRAATVRRLRSDGADIEVRAVDAADTSAMTDLLRELTERDGPLGPVIHAAGVVASEAVIPLRSVDGESVRAHARAKAAAAEALRSAVRDLPGDRRPEAVVLMSSATAFVGGLGLAPYAAVNRFLDAFAEREHVEEDGRTAWIAVAWDGWRVGPGGTERVVASRHSIGAADGMRSLDRILTLTRRTDAPPSIAVSPVDLSLRTAGGPAVAPPGDLPVPGEDGSPVEGAEGFGPAERPLAAIWSDLLGFPVTDRDADFFALGGHSLLATRMLARLRDDLGVRLRLTDLLARPTIASLAPLLETSGADPAAGTIPDPTAPSAPSAPSEPAGPGEPLDEFPLTRVQHAYWIGGSGGYRMGNVPCSFHLEYDCPDLDVARYEEAWNRVIARHPMLRAVITAEGRNRVLERVPRYRIRVRDLADREPEERNRALKRIRETMVRREPHPGRWPLVDIRAARLPDGVIRLFVNVDVLVCDTAGYFVWDRELRTFYENPDARLPLPATTFRHCVAALEARADTEDHRRAAAYWRGRMDDLPGAPALPRLPDGHDERPRFARRSARLEPECWKALTTEAARRGLTPTAVLLAAYGETLAAWSGENRLSLTLTLFDRPAGLPGAEDVVGDFTTLMLHAVDRSADTCFADAAHRAQHTLFSDLEHREFSALELLAEKASRTGRTESVPVVFTSALGLSAPLGGTHDLDWVGTPVHGVSSTPQTWLDHQVLEQHGALLLQWDVQETVIPAGEADRAFADHVARVRRLAEDPDVWDAPHPSAPATGTVPTPPSPVRKATGPAAGDPDGIVMPLRAGEGGTPLFLIHPSGGDVLCYGELARTLGGSRPVIALTDPELTGGRGPTSIPEAVERYLEAVRSVQPRGPYLLGGWSMGGTLAHAAAVELERRGERTARLVLIDSNLPDRIRDLGGTGAGGDTAVAAVRYLHSLEAFLDLELLTGPDDARNLAAMTADAVRAEVTARLRAVGLIGPRESVDLRLGVFERHLRALGTHRAGHLDDPDTRMLLIAASRRSPRNAGVGMGVDDVEDLPALGWRPHLRGPVEEEVVDGHHYSLLAGEAVRRIAELIDRALSDLPPTPG
ncbi:type I polyketide synthase [Streptomyces sp. ST2-7A]|uniref:type I polyketide synthase n=1 Tax=Streptomyces sp. ST2-7A TaxID=2907214 RepID=UPI001F3BD757|nr:type I polyketide synthase [Streptomyces sp. ST2-7A]MCE7079602.1 SDR family NAD(P)-dependent oxidoreductase [Streptomyces sp. ST2-7A]